MKRWERTLLMLTFGYCCGQAFGHVLELIMALRAL